MSTAKRGHDATRAERKAKKRKLEDAILDLPGDDAVKETEQAPKKRKHKEISGDTNRQISKMEREIFIKEEKGEKAVENKGKDGENGKKKKDKKSKDGKDGGKESVVEMVEQEGEDFASVEAPRKSKKERKAERKAAEAAERAEKGEPNGPGWNGGQSSVAKDRETEEPKSDTTKSKKNNRNRDKKRKPNSDSLDSEMTDNKPARFIVFTGNLPFTATTDSIEKHFAAVKPKSVRHLTKKEDPTKSKGCAFVEFDGYDRMKTCLKLLHHSMFDDGLSAPRKINVELTAGGGGKTKHRQAKIGQKNQKLNGERIRRMHEEDRVKLIKKESAIDHNDVHPSRRARVPDVS